MSPSSPAGDSATDLTSTARGRSRWSWSRNDWSWAAPPRQVSVIGSWTFSTVGQADCARYIADRGIKVDNLFTHTWKLEQAEEAYKLFDAQTSGKGVFLPA